MFDGSKLTTPLALAILLWVCTLPVLLLVVGPILGSGRTWGIALGLLLGLIALCIYLCLPGKPLGGANRR